MRGHSAILGMTRFLLVLASCSWFGSSGFECRAEEPSQDKPSLAWKQLPDLPNSVGVAGPFAGVHNDALIVAGGANFPDGVPWHPTPAGGKSLKRYHDRVHVLVRAGTQPNGQTSDSESVDPSDYHWVEVDARLPEPIGYGLSISTEQGLLCIGGERQLHEEDETTGQVATTTLRSAELYLVRWDPIEQTVAVSKKWTSNGKQYDLPSLPRGTAMASGGKIGDFVYLAGGDTGSGGSRQFLRLSLSPRPESAESWAWEELPCWNGPPRMHAVGVVQADQFFLFSGRNRPEGRGFEIHTDAHCFDPSAYTRELRRARINGGESSDLASYANGWRRLADIAPPGEVPRSVMAGTGAAAGFDSVLIFGGARGDILIRREEELPRLIEEAQESGDERRVARLQQEANALYDDHAGFSSDILRYSITTDSWAHAGQTPTTGPVTTTAVRWGNRVVLPSGEKTPGVRTSDVWWMVPLQGHRGFGTANWVVLVSYLAVLVAIGFVFAGRESSSDDYFLAGGRIPWWAAGLSIFGTSLSAITYLSIPARSYATNWSWSLINFGIPVVAVVVVLVYLPRLIRLQVASAYAFLEERFHVSLRVVGSISFILYQLGRMGVVVLLPALALSAVTGVSLTLCIITMGVLSTLYTALGGIEAVIWTDVVQVIVLLGGALTALVIISLNVEGGFPEIVRLAASEGKFNLVDDFHFHDLDWSKDGILVLLLAAFFVNLIPYTSDQAIIQRYLSVSDEKTARQAAWTNALMCIPATLIFFMVGTALWVFYQVHPMNLTPLQKADQIFPWFISQEMPPGLAGLVIAGVFAAAMSSLDSSMHSAATVITTDFYDRFGKFHSKAQSLRFARIITVLVGIVGTGSAMLLATVDIRFLWDLVQTILGLFLGTVGGLFSLGILTKRVNAAHAWAGAAASIALLVYVRSYTDAHGLLYGSISVASCMAVAIMASYFFPQTAPVAIKSAEDLSLR